MSTGTVETPVEDGMAASGRSETLLWEPSHMGLLAGGQTGAEDLRGFLELVPTRELIEHWMRRTSAVAQQSSVWSSSRLAFRAESTKLGNRPGTDQAEA